MFLMVLNGDCSCTPGRLKSFWNYNLYSIVFYSENNKICHFFSKFTQKERPISLLKKFYKIYQSLANTLVDPVFFSLKLKKKTSYTDLKLKKRIKFCMRSILFSVLCLRLDFLSISIFFALVLLHELKSYIALC